MINENIIEVKDMIKTIGDFSLKEISFSLERGYIMGFLGRNGAGKTTTIKTILNLYVKESGIIDIFGLDNFNNEKEVKDKIGYVSDEKMYFDDMTIDKTRKLIKSFYSKWSDEYYFELLERFELNKSKKIKELSKGSYKKFSILMALAHKPELLVLDEPTSDLDPIFRKEFLNILRDFVSNEKNSVIFSSHITNDLDKIADYIVLIDNGEIKLNKSKEELLNNYRIVKGKESFLNYFKEEYFIGYNKNDFSIEGLCSNIEVAKKLEKKGCVLEVPTLEDIMFYNVKGVEKNE
ncbi:MAG: ABC transporter ATP-binding protein [Clostridiales bacterium]